MDEDVKIKICLDSFCYGLLWSCTLDDAENIELTKNWMALPIAKKQAIQDITCKRFLSLLRSANSNKRSGS